jgi:hypothetical protein
MVFFAPIATTLFSTADYAELTGLLEHRGNLEILLKRIELKRARRDRPGLGVDRVPSMKRDRSPRARPACGARAAREGRPA